MEAPFFFRYFPVKQLLKGKILPACTGKSFALSRENRMDFIFTGNGRCILYSLPRPALPVYKYGAKIYKIKNIFNLGGL
ncbi:hypothetical protein A6M21_04505 [Desulfotomaculum copahuensis]|uniref:Uncharacterized protein n=1 Tax=Desulfotomaculum copahuensis TaxID=1838280 RepID=A0A1B7LHJ2_9FIRM|nr:hypothetical protein A6M21_04505 [Desulfotomaculum copahuensis]